MIGSKKIMKTIRYELKIIHKKEIVVTVDDSQNTEEILRTMIALEPDFEMPNAKFLGILVQKVDEQTCPEDCENCSYLCPESMECTMKDKENHCMNCEYRCPECGASSLYFTEIIFPVERGTISCYRRINLLFA